MLVLNWAGKLVNCKKIANLKTKATDHILILSCFDWEITEIWALRLDWWVKNVCTRVHRVMFSRAVSSHVVFVASRFWRKMLFWPYLACVPLYACPSLSFLLLFAIYDSRYKCLSVCLLVHDPFTFRPSWSDSIAYTALLISYSPQLGHSLSHRYHVHLYIHDYLYIIYHPIIILLYPPQRPMKPNKGRPTPACTLSVSSNKLSMRTTPSLLKAEKQTVHWLSDRHKQLYRHTNWQSDKTNSSKTYPKRWRRSPCWNYNPLRKFLRRQNEAAYTTPVASNSRPKWLISVAWADQTINKSSYMESYICYFRSPGIEKKKQPKNN